MNENLKTQLKINNIESKLSGKEYQIEIMKRLFELKSKVTKIDRMKEKIRIIDKYNNDYTLINTNLIDFEDYHLFLDIELDVFLEIFYIIQNEIYSLFHKKKYKLNNIFLSNVDDYVNNSTFKIMIEYTSEKSIDHSLYRDISQLLDGSIINFDSDIVIVKSLENGEFITLNPLHSIEAICNIEFNTK